MSAKYVLTDQPDIALMNANDQLIVKLLLLND